MLGFRRLPSFLRIGGPISVAWGLGACDRAPPEPASLPEISDSDRSDPPPGSSPGPSCLVALAETPPPTATSLEHCPVDPEGRPTMPRGKVRFVDASDEVELDVEIADNDPDRAHGLMFRPTLSDGEGMLFSWPTSAPRSFWMRNTCLALDMLFLDEAGFVLGAVEQVPPWNEAPRRIACPAAHVLEVRAGWVRAHGIKSGQKVEIETTP